MSAPSLQLLVVAKAPEAGRVKTRLGRDLGMDAAAEVAAASLLDTLDACIAAVGPSACHLALAGDLDPAVRGDEIARRLAGWTVRPQVGDDFGARLARAHAEVPGHVVQVGMDTPQVRADDLLAVGAALADDPAVLGPADDGGWWVLGLRDGRRAAPLAGVAMSTATTYDDTRAALADSGLRVAECRGLRDVDTVADARVVAADAPGTAFARSWARHVGALA